MNSNLPPGCGQLPGEWDDGVTEMQELIQGFIEDDCRVSPIATDLIIEIVAFDEHNYDDMPETPEVEFLTRYAKHLHRMADRLEKKISYMQAPAGG